MLHVRSEVGPRSAEQAVVCVHGITQNGEIFHPLLDSLGRRGARAAALDLRGHGKSLYEPPWNVATHVEDLRLTAAGLGIERATWVGHSLGARIVSALALAHPDLVERLVLLDPPFRIPAVQALRQAELHYQDWSFQTLDGALNALLSAETVVSASRSTVAEYVSASVDQGPDGRYRFSFCPPAVAVAWSEIALPPPAIADVPTLIVRPEGSMLARDHDSHYAAQLGEGYRFVEVPNGHNVMWDAPAETTAALLRFLDEAT